MRFRVNKNLHSMEDRKSIPFIPVFSFRVTPSLEPDERQAKILTLPDRLVVGPKRTRLLSQKSSSSSSSSRQEKTLTQTQTAGRFSRGRPSSDVDVILMCAFLAFLVFLSFWCVLILVLPLDWALLRCGLFLKMKSFFFYFPKSAV